MLTLPTPQDVVLVDGLVSPIQSEPFTNLFMVVSLDTSVMLDSYLSCRVPSKEGEDEKRKQNKQRDEEEDHSLKDPLTADNNLPNSETPVGNSLEKGSKEPKKRFGVNRLTSEEHRAGKQG